jgi:hypothetical protein
MNPVKIVVENWGRIALSMGYRAKFGANFEKMGVFQFRYEFCPNVKTN